MGKHREHMEKLVKDLESVLIEGVYTEDDGSVVDTTPEEYFENQILSDYIRETDGKRIWQLSSDYLMLNVTDHQYEYGDDTVKLGEECAVKLDAFVKELDEG